MRWDANLDPLSNDIYLKKQQGPAPEALMAPDVAANLSRVKQRAGWLSPQTQIALAKVNATNEVIDAAGRLQAKQIAEAQVAPDTRSIKTQIYDNLKATSRWATAALNFIPEYTQGAVAQLFDKNDDINGWFISTSLGTMIENPELRGQGFFLSEEGMKKQAERARRYRGTVNGSAWTVGRGAANLVNLQPNTKPYNILSGVLDAIVMVKADPTGPVTKTFKQINSGRYMVPLLSNADVAPELLNALDEAGVAQNALGVTVNGQKFLKFWETKRASALVDDLVKETSAVKIADKFEGALDNEIVVKLAEAGNREEVIDALAGAWKLEDGSLFRDIRRYQRPVARALAPVQAIGDIVQKIPFVDGIRKSRWFQEMPDTTVIINGTDEDNRKGARNIIQFLKAANVNDAEVEAIGDLALRALRQGSTAADKKQLLDVFNTAVRAALTANGMDAELADDMIRRANGGIEAIRAYMLDRQGMPTDNKMFSFLANTNHDYLPAEEIEALVEMFGNPKNMVINGPLELSELLNRVHILPDVREVRRATSNPWLSKITDVRVASKSTKRAFTVIKPEMKDEYDKAISRLAALADQYPKQSMMPQTVAEEIVNLQKTIADSQTVVMRRVNTGEQRAAIQAIEHVQNRIWKPLALATGGYVIRNSMDAQVRMAFGGLNSALTHPFEYMMLVLGQSQRRTIGGDVMVGYGQTGKVWNRIVNGTARLLGGDKLELIAEADQTAVEQAMRQNARFGLRQQGFDATDAGEVLRKSGSWQRATRADVNGLEFHTDGVMNNAALIFGDDLQRLAAEHLAGGGDANGAVARLVEYAKSRQDILDEIEDVYKNGFPVIDPETGKTAKIKDFKPFAQMNRDELDTFLQQHMRRVVVGNVETQTGNIDDLRFMAAFNQIPETVAEKGVVRRVAPLEILEENLQPIRPGEIPRVGTVVQISEERVGVVTGFRDETGQVIVDPFGVVSPPKILPFEVGTTPTPSNPSSGILFHGTSRPLMDGSFRPVFDIYTPDANNLFGRGIYLTDDPRVASSYTSKGTTSNTRTKIGNITVGVEGVVYGVRLSPDAKILDLRLPNNNIRSEISLIISENWFQDSIEESTTQLEALLSDVNTPAETLIAALKDVMQGMTLENADIVSYSLSESISKYADVLSYQGGVRRGGMGRHNAFVVLNESKLSIERTDDVKNLVEMITPSESVVLGNGKTAVVTPVTGEPAFGTNSQGIAASRRLVKAMPLWDDVSKTGLPPVVKREIMKRDVEDKKGLFSLATKEMDKFTNWFFGELYAKATNILDRSPTFRQYYGRIIAEQADMLSPDEAEKLVKQISTNAKTLGISEPQYLGSKETWNTLKASRLTQGTATAQELDDYARFMALQQTKELLYDASNKTNLEDALRIIMPFAPAWREVIGTYIGFLKGNPIGTARSFQRVYSGALGADYDNDGRGFFYSDPTTGQKMFAFPGSGALAKILTGVNAPLEAPIKRFSQGINAYPSLGPMMQVAASWLPDRPELDQVKQYLLPYGEKSIGSAFNPVPQWTDKFIQAIRADTGKLDNVYGNTYVETLRALSASGDYNLDDPNSVNQLYKDAKGKARILTLLRAASQFLGPTAGATEFSIPTKQGDQFVSALVKEFYDLQAKDYDTAVPKFLDLYGDEVTLYVASKTRSLQEGLEATQEFSDWERRNGDLLSQYENTAAYLAPAGSEFNFTVWQRQLQQGKRERLTDREIVKIAQERIGSAKYRAARRLVGPYPNETQKNVLRQYREYLHSQYPGFPLKAEFTVGKFENDVEELRNLIADPRVSDNPTAKAVSEYLGYLDQAVAVYVSRGGQPSGFATAKSASALRDAMASIGEALAQREPGFSRVWQRLLAQQVED